MSVATAQTTTDTAEPPAPPAQLEVTYDVPVPMRDGTVLRCDIARPVTGRWPVVLVRTPYGKERPTMGAALSLTGLAREGFVAIIQDTRNRFMSEGDGDFVPFLGDGDDGEDTIAWAAALPYSTGEVCTYGTSYHGYTQWASAVRNPPALRAMVPFMSPGRPRTSLFFRNGVWELEGMAGWFCLIGMQSLQRRHAGDPQAFQAAAGALLSDFQGLMSGDWDSLPLSRFKAMSNPDVGKAFFDVLGCEDGELPLIRSLECTQRFEDVTVPAMLVGGWYDYFSHATIEQFVGMRTRGGSEHARSGTQLVMGPWGHATGLKHLIGERNFGALGAATALHPDGEIAAAARYLKGRLADDAVADTPVKIFVMGANTWRDEQEWPLARTAWRPMYLAGGGRLTQAPPAPQGGAADSYVYDPANPVPTWGGNTLGLISMTGPRDQRAIEQRDDVLVYTSEALSQDLEVTGNAVVELWASTDCEDTDFVARLVDVQPDGTAYNVAEGIVRGRHRDGTESFAPGTPMVPGEPHLLSIKLSPTSNLFRAGHRIRVHVTSSNFPRWARNLNIWDDRDATLENARVARQVVHHDGDHASRIVLPVIPAAHAIA
jgi:putative CocE/NonD family hydrolase